MTVGDGLQLLFLYVLCMGKLLVVGLRPKWRLSFNRTCLYIVCECGRHPKVVISVRTSYGEIVGNRVEAKMAIEFFPYMPIQRM